MNIHYESGIQSALPQFPNYTWDNASFQLEQILLSHEEVAQQGDRYLVGRLMRQVQLEGHPAPVSVYYDYILTREGESWDYVVAVYHESTPYNYDFDVFEMRPIESSLCSY
jgi:hypothetical protein